MSNWVSYCFNLIVVFFLSPYVVHRLGNTAYGVWVLVVSLIGYLGLLDFGVRGAVTLYIAKFHASSEDERASRVVSSAVAIFAVAGGFAILVSLLTSLYATQFLQIPPEIQESARTVLRLAGFTVATSLLGSVFGGVIAGVQRFEVLNAVEVIGTVLRALTVWLCLHLGYGLVALFCIELAFSVIRGLTNAFLSQRVYPAIRARLSYCDQPHIKLIFSFGIYAFVISVFNQLIHYSDALVIGVFLPVSFITFFSIAGNLIAYTRGIISGITIAIGPLASSLEARGRLAELRQTVPQYAAYCSMLAFPIGITFLLRGRSFIQLWMGMEYGELSEKVLQVLTLGLLVSAGNSVIWPVAYGMRRHKAIIPLIMVEGSCNLILSCLLVRPFGVVGVPRG